MEPVQQGSLPSVPSWPPLQAIINDRSKGPDDSVQPPLRGVARTEEDMENIVQAAATLLEDDEERYIIRGTGDRVGAMDYFTEYEYQTFLLPAIEHEPYLLEFEIKSDTIINIPVPPPPPPP